MTTKSLKYAEYMMIFTSTDEKTLSAEDCLACYRARWQIELAFKRLKSLAKFGHLPKHDPDSAKAWLYGKLFVALLAEKLIRHAEAVSPSA